MELRNEKDARFIIRHHVTEEKLLHLEKGVRKLGFSPAERGSCRSFWAFPALYGSKSRNRRNDRGRTHDDRHSLCHGIRVWNLCPFEGWLDAKKQIHLQFEAGRMEDNYQWEYRFYEDGYEVIGKNEKSRVQYKNVGRLIDMSGMYVLVERGNVVRYFMKDDAVQEIPRSLRDF